MKKVLFATTALIATAGMAAADVKISGYGRFGLDYNDFNSNDLGDAMYNGVSETNITSRLRLQFDMTTETDGGVTVGARFRAQAENRDGNPGGAVFNGARFFATYSGFTVGVGNIIGAIENVPGMYLETRSAGSGIDGMGFNSLVTIANGEGFNFDSYDSTGSGPNGVELLYSAGGFSGHISYSTANDFVGGTPPALVQDTDRIAAHVAYTWNDWTFALGAQDSDYAWEDKVFVSVAGNLGQFGVRLAYADNDGVDKYGLYGNMDIGAASNLLLWVAREDGVSGADVLAGRNDNRGGGVIGSATGSGGVYTGTEGTAYGIHYTYDLGGGVSFEAAAVEAATDQTQVQAGLYFSF